MNKNTSISLGNHFDDFIKQGIQSGRYASASEIVRAALRLLEKEESKIILLKKAIEEGEASGIVENFKPEQHLAELHRNYAK